MANRRSQIFGTGRNVGAIFVVAVMVLSAGAVLVAHSSAAPSPSNALSATHSNPSASSSPLTGGGGSNVDKVKGTFFGTNSTFADRNPNGSVCSSDTYRYNSSAENLTEYENFCSTGPQDPSSVHFGGNSIGTAYSSITNDTGTASCPGAADLVHSGVYFQTSSNSGANWGSWVNVGNATCSYLQSYDPSVALADGTVYMAFVESNASNATKPIMPPMDNLSSDAIGFTTSSDNGSSFAPVVTLAAAGVNNVTDPQVAAIGDTVYVVYVNTANWTNMTLPTPAPTPSPFYPSSINIVSSTDGGATWNGPYLLPGENASDGFTADSPAIAINSLGELAVSYATDRTCILISGYCDDDGDSIVVSTSSTNGTSWSAPVTVAPVAGEYGCQFENPLIYQCLPGPEAGPHSSIAFAPSTPSLLYVVFTESYYTWNTTSTGEGGGSGTTNIGYGQALMDAVSSNTGANFTVHPIEVPISAFSYDYDALTDPSVTVSVSGEVYVAFTWLNETSCTGCNPAFDDYTSYWMGYSTTQGATWTVYPALLTNVYEFDMEEEWVGLTSSVTVTSAGPVGVFGEGLEETDTEYEVVNFSATPPIYIYWFNESFPSNLLSVFPSQGSPVAVNFTETGLPANATWGFILSGNVFISNDTTIRVTNVPYDTSLTYTANAVPVAYWTEYFAVSSIGDEYTFYGPQNVSVSYGLYFGIAFHISPVGIGTFTGTGMNDADLYVEVEIDVGGQYLFWEWYSELFTGIWYNGTDASAPFPWYLPAGSSVALSSDVYTDLPLTYVFGNGNGSATGLLASATATMNGPINESYYAGALGTYGLTFTPVGLPAGSSYSFDFAGTTYSGTAPSSVTVPGVATGEYPLTDVAASSTTPGYAYFAPNTPSEVDVPVQTEVALNFSTDVDTTGTLGTASFQAVGLANGDYWQLLFNGTTYGSLTPWINVTTHPGTFGVGSFPITASANDSTAYTAEAFGPSLSVSPGSTYLVNFSLAYRVVVSSSVGGTATGVGSHWLTPGSTASFQATPTSSNRFLGWAGDGAGSYSGTSSYANITVGGPISETANFAGLPANRYNLTLTEVGLPTGTWWTVSLNGTGYSSEATSFQVGDLYSCTAGASGQYSVAVPFVYLNGTAGIRYVAAGYPSSTCTSGASSVTIVFHAEYLVSTYSAGGGTASLSVAGEPTESSVWLSGGTAVQITATPAAGNVFAGWLGTGPGNYSGELPTEDVIPTGTVTEVATFQSAPVPYVPTYTVSFQLGTAVAAGTSWSLVFNGTVHTSTSGSINVSGLAPGNYSLSVPTAYSPDRTAEYVAHGLVASLDVTANRTFSIDYATAFWVTVGASTGGSLSPAQSGYYANGATVNLVATPSPGYSFVGWVGTGTGSYTGSASDTNVTVTGPIGESASFALIPPGATSTSFLASTAGVAVLAVVGLIVGLAVGIVVFRRRGPKSSPPQEWKDGGSP
jgi:Divergent InlB B-repeat domain